jgi:murein DD-endopeptidase MepM/ murein hydrolase activator NlpD
MEAQLGTSARRHHDLQATLAESHILVRRLQGERERADARGNYYRKRIGDLERRLNRLLTQQAQLVGEIEDRALATIDGLEDTVYATGLDLDELLRRMDEELGMGGPYVGLPPLAHDGNEFDGVGYMLAGPGPPVAFNSALDRLQARLTRWKERVPLTPPVDHFYVSSTFGKRQDPFTGKWAIHSGVDMSGPRNSDILATAPGTVTYAGWMGQYGRMVEIDHGYGLTTRYGHLRKIVVEAGQTVAFRDKIGIMGSTGRSTDRHVHYEIRFDGEPVDPAKFIEAGRNVLKN